MTLNTILQSIDWRHQIGLSRRQLTAGHPGAAKSTQEPREVVLSCRPNEQFLKINYSCVLKILENCCFTSMGDQKSERMGPPDLGAMVKLGKNIGFKKL